MPSFIQYAIVTESAFNVLGATGFLLFPEWCLKHVLLATPTFPMTTALTIPLSTSFLLQGYGCLTLALTIPLLSSLPSNTPASSRALTYQTLAAGEVLLIALFLSQATQAEKCGFSATSLVVSAGTLMPLLLWRIYALLVDPAVLAGSELRMKRKNH